MLASRTSLHAQSAGPTIVVGGDDKPWNRGVPTGRREAARALFLEGNRLFKVPLFSRAAESYAAALEQWNHPAFHFNLAIAQLNLGLEVEARDNLEQALKHGEEPLGAAQYAEAKKQLEEVEHQLGRLRIRCVTPGAEVTLDGATLFTGPGSHAGWTKPKVHEITAKRDGYLSEARRVTIAPGQVQELELNLITLSEAADKGRRWATWKPWTVVAAGAAIAAAGGVFHALSSRSFNAYDDGFVQLPCSTMPDPQSPGCARDKIPAALNAQLNAARRDQAIAVGGYVAGGAVITAGVVLLYLNRPRLIEQRGATRSVAVVPTVSGDTIGILLHVSE
jgi:tetratricopeptide (TPR) repeat protein